MKFIFDRASVSNSSLEPNKNEPIEISSLDELRDLCIKEDEMLIIDLRPGEESITVYDAYVE